MTLIEFLKRAIENNAAVSVTGMLLFNAGNFMQLLEGPRAHVTDTFCRISSDPRHKNIELISANPAPFRMFGDWSMHYISSSGKSRKLLQKYRVDATFNPNTLSEKGAERLCSEFAELYQGQVGENGAAEQSRQGEFYQQ